MLKLMSDILTMIFKVASENKPYMSNIAYIDPDKKQQNIVSLWAGAGIGANPIKRIIELREENEFLRLQLKKKEIIKIKFETPIKKG